MMDGVMHEDIDENTIDRFAMEARAFCTWARGDDGVVLDVRSALVRVVALYNAAILLPHPWNERLSSELAEAETPKAELELVLRRASALPLQFYSEIFDPFERSPEPVTGHITDDIGDIYSDVARGLVLYERGQHDEALWEWGFNLKIHWGAHATGAIRALHAYLAQEKPDGLARST
ncbi:MAG: DUF5063 domain-containing protein [Steroidobacter sp.]|nr:DUF5063 domain-containing protein [Steroidobacter sp.]